MKPRGLQRLAARHPGLISLDARSGERLPCSTRPRTNGLLPFVRLEVFQLEAVQGWRHGCASHLALRSAPSFLSLASESARLTTPHEPPLSQTRKTLPTDFENHDGLHCAVPHQRFWVVGGMSEDLRPAWVQDLNGGPVLQTWQATS